PLGGPCAAAEPPPRPDAAALTGALVVAIDDDPVQLAALGALFRRWGCEVVAAASAAEALARLGKAGRTPDAIVADYRLRGSVTGAEAIAALRAKLGAPVPGMILTGDTEPARLIEARASGFELLHKPVDPDRLRRVLRGLLSATAAP
ncbi:MAG TPA: response regulator, partial [Dongiaceae bacterium]|nr:response regulator [Dongiaceae bacterium]